uniref:Metallo-beta-lactamase domain-containing protein n=1 Tax=Populus trichocarpa TaxID=3694 RepID=A0A2K1X4P7_POPTR
MASTGQSQSLKRRDAPVTREGGDQLTLTPLGAGNEVGRSCVYMSFKGKTVLFDYGIHPAYSGMTALPSMRLTLPLLMYFSLHSMYFITFSC